MTELQLGALIWATPFLALALVWALGHLLTN
jgi:hypothetical protein